MFLSNIHSALLASNVTSLKPRILNPSCTTFLIILDRWRPTALGFTSKNVENGLGPDCMMSKMDSLYVSDGVSECLCSYNLILGRNGNIGLALGSPEILRKLSVKASE